MSFLNPVNEPVLRFKSTDAGAPQINYNSRVAGDVKAVLKACLVTGYGTKASAGWSIVNEVSHVAEFVSPAVAMSDYRLGIDDTSTSSTTWYYQYQDARVNPANNQPAKAFSYTNAAHVSNGWQLLATQRGFILIEILWFTSISKPTTRITYFGQVKSGLISANNANMMFFNIGHNATTSGAQYFYQPSYPHLSLAGYNSTRIFAANNFSDASVFHEFDLSSIDITSALYLSNPAKTVILGEIPALLSCVVNSKSDMYLVADQDFNGRPVLNVTAGNPTTIDYAYGLGRVFLMYLDYWEY